MITTEDLKTIYDRAIQYCIAAFGDEPNNIEIYEDGTLIALYVDYCCGSREESSESIPIEKLTEDLDEVIKERKQREEDQRIKRQQEEIEREKLRKEMLKQEELATLKKLKEKYEL
jgi:hypothetical protein